MSSNEQMSIIQNGNVKDIIDFAAQSSESDIAELQAAVIQHGDAWDAFTFAKEVRGADIQALQNAVIEYGDGWDAYAFARDIDGADIAALQSVVIQKGSAWDAYCFASNLTDKADMHVIRNRLVYLHSRGEDFGNLAEFDRDENIQKRMLDDIHEKMCCG